VKLLTYAAKRTVLVLASALVVSSVVFIGVHQLPGNAFLSERVSADQVQALIHHFHLDEPWPQQYVAWIAGVFQGNLGESLVYRGQYVLPLLIPKIAVSLELGVVALAVAIAAGMGLGIVAAMRQNRWIDYLASTTAVVAYSMPNFVIAAFLLLLLSTVLYQLTGGAIYYEVGWGSSPDQVLVPALALGLPFSGIIARQTRAAMIEELRQDYVRTAWSKGLSERAVVLRHVLRNGLIPVITILGPVATSILTGGLVVENVFGIPGLGREFINTILARDYNVVVAIFTLYALFIGLVNVAVDVLYPIIDPRIQL
jgi:ABC-type dipeptide/oligopeptide/nickel transport system permease component